MIAQSQAGWPKGWEQVEVTALRAGMDPMEALAALRASRTVWTITGGMSTVVTCFWDKPDSPARLKAIAEARARLTFEFGEPIKHSPNQQALHFGHPDYQSAHLSPIGNSVMVSRLVR